MQVEDFVQELKNIGIKEMFGVPDSTLKQFCDYLNREGSGDFTHMVLLPEVILQKVVRHVYICRTAE